MIPDLRQKVLEEIDGRLWLEQQDFWNPAGKSREAQVLRALAVAVKDHSWDGGYCGCGHGSYPCPTLVDIAIELELDK